MSQPVFLLQSYTLEFLRGASNRWLIRNKAYILDDSDIDDVLTVPTFQAVFIFVFINSSVVPHASKVV